MPAGEAGKTTGPSRQNLLRLWLIRSILVAALLFATAWLWQFSEVELPWIPLLALLLGTALVNVPLLGEVWQLAQELSMTRLLCAVAVACRAARFAWQSSQV